MWTGSSGIISNHPFCQVAVNCIHPFFKSSWCKIASMVRNWINSVQQAAATTFTFSSVFISFLCDTRTPFGRRNFVSTACLIRSSENIRSSDNLRGAEHIRSSEHVRSSEQHYHPASRQVGLQRKSVFLSSFSCHLIINNKKLYLSRFVDSRVAPMPRTSFYQIFACRLFTRGYRKLRKGIGIGRCFSLLNIKQSPNLG